MAKKDKTMQYLIGAGLVLGGGYLYMQNQQKKQEAEATNTNYSGSGGSSSGGGGLLSSFTNGMLSDADVESARNANKQTREQIRLENKIDRINNRTDKKIKRAKARNAVREAKQSGQVKWYQFRKKNKIRKAAMKGFSDDESSYAFIV